MELTFCLFLRIICKLEEKYVRSIDYMNMDVVFVVSPTGFLSLVVKLIVVALACCKSWQSTLCCLLANQKIDKDMKHGLS